ncbi:hypothetical protein COCCU_11545 [Corynebacterium occultum]|uniref:DUF3073 domain-containing protein n=1 Tax=Corynebacterium occultum TaxID=2675219 RepID=A0A6B8WDY1_9CORY|nr:DUF3073 domain-containing protein [Corynebacterium occultum]QGU08210.1 hypothetical protein COCCU_11545 [Corynebacterium occultum]
MGRGRAKAKQTKVARQLKYSTHEMDLDSLQRELASQSPQPRSYEEDPEDDYEDSYEDYADRYAEYVDLDDEDDVAGAPPGRR